MTKAIMRFLLVHVMIADWAANPTNPTSLTVIPPINGCYHPHPPSPFVVITQPKSDTHFYRPTEGVRLSRLRHCSKGAQSVPKTVYHSGCRDKHNWPRPLTPQSIMPSLNHCDLLRHVGVNNLPKVVVRQCGSRELNSQPPSCKSKWDDTQTVPVQGVYNFWK